MDIASPDVELLGFCVALLAILGALAASIISLRDKISGAWVMLAGAAFLLLSMVPRGLEQFVNYQARNGYEPPDIPQLMYYAFWNWLPNAAALVFAAGLVITALQRRGLAKRISELEGILSTVADEGKK